MKTNIRTAVQRLVMSMATKLITKKYSLEEINQGYEDLMDGKNIRGVVVHQH